VVVSAVPVRHLCPRPTFKTTLSPTAPLRPAPAWGKVKKLPESESEAAFAAGAGLAAIDAIVSVAPAFVRFGANV